MEQDNCQTWSTSSRSWINPCWYDKPISRAMIRNVMGQPSTPFYKLNHLELELIKLLAFLLWTFYKSKYYVNMLFFTPTTLGMGRTEVCAISVPWAALFEEIFFSVWTKPPLMFFGYFPFSWLSSDNTAWGSCFAWVSLIFTFSLATSSTVLICPRLSISFIQKVATTSLTLIQEIDSHSQGIIHSRLSQILTSSMTYWILAPVVCSWGLFSHLTPLIACQ